LPLKTVPGNTGAVTISKKMKSGTVSDFSIHSGFCFSLLFLLFIFDFHFCFPF